jgi:hypothetical protein
LSYLIRHYSRLSAFHFAVSIAYESQINYTRLANCWTFIGQIWAGGQLPDFYDQPKNDL